MDVSSKQGRMNGIESFSGAEILDRINQSPFGKTQHSSTLTGDAECMKKIFKESHGKNEPTLNDCTI
jgi:hypothetical protein